MAETFQSNSIAAGHDNTAGYTNIEELQDSTNRYFEPVDDLGRWLYGVDTIRGDGLVVEQGQNSFTWRSAYLTIEQYYYLYNTLLSGSRSGLVTAKTRIYDATTYVDCNATLTLPAPPTLSKGVNEYRPFIWQFTRVTTGAS